MKRKKTAVFISALYEDMVRQTADGMLGAAQGENIKLLFFTSFADNHTSQNYDLIRTMIRVILLCICFRA